MQTKWKNEDQAVANVHGKLPETLQRVRKLASEKGASSWLTVMPLRHHGFAIHKGAFRDALAPRYGWALERLPSQCICGKPFNTDHALNCPIGGFLIACHNEVRDLLASLITEVCSDVAVEPALQPIRGETFQRRSTSTNNLGNDSTMTTWPWTNLIVHAAISNSNSYNLVVQHLPLPVGIAELIH